MFFNFYQALLKNFNLLVYQDTILYNGIAMNYFTGTLIILSIGLSLSEYLKVTLLILIYFYFIKIPIHYPSLKLKISFEH